MDLAGSLTALRSALDDVRLPLDLPDAAQATASARQIVAQLDDYVLPRLVDLDAPLLAVVGGSTGAGKSTLVNSLIGRVVSQPGVIRPTTRSPVLVHNPEDERWFANDRILPGLVRSRVASNADQALHLVAEPTLPPGLAILDAPDIDSVVEENRALASQLLDAADLWLFITSAARYADAVPWEFLQTAADRGASVAVVLDRVPPAAVGVVPTDLGKMMTERGLAEAPLFAVPETVVDDLGLLPDAAVAAIRTYLATLAADKSARERVVLRTLDGAVSSVAGRAPQVADAVDAQADVRDQLASDATKSFAEASRAVSVQSADGTLLRGEVLSRWHDYVGSSDLLRSLDSQVSRIRDRIQGFLTGSVQRGEQVGVAAAGGLEALILEEGTAAAERATSAWQGNPAGRQILRTHPELTRPSEVFAEAAARTIREWQSDVLHLVGEEGKGKRSAARIAAYGVNGLGAALMLVIFFQTGGLTGAEGGVAIGTSVLAQRLLESVFGDEAVRRLARTAKSELDARVEGLMASELVRYSRALDALPIDREQAVVLRSAIAGVEAAHLASAPGASSGGAGTRPELVGREEPPQLAAPQTRVQLNSVADAQGAEYVEAELVNDEEERG
ncbi:dynamin family protein [Brooklawnia cerclae]|uniref:Energy-coupling factor transporter ATP-binding protein EcfA2 n=1 Tax=Brooklawnia cerclae TaxID=349934 RepID=A0ABX0SG61_9ACTN|nr:ABC transporter [Brooklawnia cerclae]NIH57363.1 energy-coupling factor transporter ATP-binding protein EcfA2 [Brooklawnia cerclae]